MPVFGTGMCSCSSARARDAPVPLRAAARPAFFAAVDAAWDERTLPDARARARWAGAAASMLAPPVTAASAFVPLGRLNLVANLAIALVKALLVVFMFMHVRRGTPMIRVFALAGLMWLALLVALSCTDLAVRLG